MDSVEFEKYQQDLLKRKHSKVIKFLNDRGGIIDWGDKELTPKLINMIHDAIPDVVQSYYETETYMLNEKFDNEKDRYLAEKTITDLWKKERRNDKDNKQKRW